MGCGSGLSGDVISEWGHIWIGLDISKSMLDIAWTWDSKGDLILADMGKGFDFNPGTFDAIISVSAL